jgi:hypothetical protein
MRRPVSVKLSLSLSLVFFVLFFPRVVPIQPSRRCGHPSTAVSAGGTSAQSMPRTRLGTLAPSNRVTRAAHITWSLCSPDGRGTTTLNLETVGNGKKGGWPRSGDQERSHPRTAQPVAIHSARRNRTGCLVQALFLDLASLRNNWGNP